MRPGCAASRAAHTRSTSSAPAAMTSARACGTPATSTGPCSPQRCVLKILTLPVRLYLSVSPLSTPFAVLIK